MTSSSSCGYPASSSSSSSASSSSSLVSQGFAVKIQGLKFSNSHSDPALVKAVGPSRSPPPPTPRLRLSLYLRLRSFSLRLCMPNASWCGAIRADKRKTQKTHTNRQKKSFRCEKESCHTRSSVTKCEPVPFLSFQPLDGAIVFFCFSFSLARSRDFFSPEAARRLVFLFFLLAPEFCYCSGCPLEARTIPSRMRK